MHDERPNRPGQGNQGESASTGERLEVATERVVPTVSVPALRVSLGEPGEAGDLGQDALLDFGANGEGAEFELPWAGLRHLSARVRALVRWTPFSFGQGFVGYRPDMGWPQGVQEDYDVHWDWLPPAH